MSEETPSHTQQGDHRRDRAIRLFTYLRELAQLRSKVIRTLDDYEVLWFSDIPREQECFTQAWGAVPEEREDIWLEIKKPKFPHVPSVPTELRLWVREVDLVDSSKDEPELLQRILVPVEEEKIQSEDTGATTLTSGPKFLELNDHLHLVDQWADYLEQKWKPWAKEHRRLKKVQEIYTKLFTIYQKQKSLGETFELVIGFGLLSWQSPNNQRVYRHLMTAQATITFDPDKGTLSVGSPVEGPKPMLEQDMLEASERPIPEVQNRIEQQVVDLGDDIWNIAGVEAALRSWVQAVSSEGIYSGELVSTAEPITKPSVSYSPALILRKRTERGFIRVYQEIIEQLKSGGELPVGIVRTVEILDDYQVHAQGLEESNGPGDFNQVFFPLPSNDEQRRIIEAVNTRQGVLVQGPPGTGKSHTIVNLICHLLATGKRVLITSQTPRALKVLKEKILKEESTKEIAALCVSLLGNDSFALKDLEDSVQGITDRYHNWNPHNNTQLTDSLRHELDELRKRLATLTRQLREVRERETYEHDLWNGAYHGTAQQIAQQVSTKQTKHGWLQIRIDLEKDPPVTDQEALELLSLCRELTPERVNELEKPVVALDELPTPEDFVRLRDTEALANASYSTFADLAHTETWKKLKAADTEKRNQLKVAIEELLTARASVLKNSQPWVSKAVNDILSARDRSWRELNNKSREHLAGLLAEARAAEERRLILPPVPDRATIVADAKALLDHLEKGGGFGFPFFRPKPVKSAWYLIQGTRIDGRLCKDIDSLKALLATLAVDLRLYRLWSYWKPFASRVEGSRPAQVGELEDLCEPLEAALHLHELIENAKAACMAIEGLPHPAWHLIDDVELYRRLLEGILSEQSLEQARAVFTKADHVFRMALTKPDVHPVIAEGHQAVLQRDERAYGLFYTKILALDTTRRRLARRTELDAKLRLVAATVADRLANEVHMDFWDETLAHFTDSWRWAQAHTWLKWYIEGDSEAQLSQGIKDIENHISVTTGSLAAALAWGYCLSRLKPAEREHLTAWRQAIKRIGKGTGKRAEIHRREARENMEGCRGAIPAWIMPLYRVAETLKPAPDTYDVVIIDEASQSGPDALFLQYIAKKIVVVGDDMQISPDSIGVPREDVDLLRDRYLRDLPLPHIGALGVEETSFFHLAEILFGGRIILREHFRCVPEIIQFSNDLCYQSTPLVPLRQYPPNRLSPVIARHVPDGCREGGTQTPRNLQEAQAIVNEIAKCCQDPAYQGKTMGVISLLGEYQAHLIRQKLIELIGPEEIERRDLVCGDAYAFQGDERDIIFLSLVAAQGETGMYALTGQKHQRRFNVAASRARDQMWLFHTPTINDFRNKECLRFRLLNYCQNPKRQHLSIEGIDIEQLKHDAQTAKRSKDNHPQPFGSWFEVDVFLRIVDKGYYAVPQFEVAGYSIDLVVEGLRGRLAIECDGDQWHGPDRYEADMMRERTLIRCGCTFWRIRGSEFYHDPDQAMASLWELLNKLRIAPGGQDIESDTHETKNEKWAKNRVRQDFAQVKEKVNEADPIHNEQENANPEETVLDQESLFSARDKSAKPLNRLEMLETIVAVLPSQGRMLRSEAIRAAARLLRNEGRVEFQRVRENGPIWNEFKSAINSGIRRGLLDGDTKMIWRITSNDPMPNRKVEDTHLNTGTDRSAEFTVGDRVRHPLWGMGTVLEAEGFGEDAQVVVRFATVGTKRLVVSVAKLERTD